MDVRVVQRVHCWINQICDLGLRFLWYFLHLLVSLWYIGAGIACEAESYLISSGLFSRYEALNVGKVRYLAVVIESKDAYKISKVLQLLQWLQTVGVKHVCLYDSEGVLKKSREFIVGNVNGAVQFEKSSEEVQSNHKLMTLEFASISDGKEAIAKAANILYAKHLKLVKANARHDEVFTEAEITDALRTLGYKAPPPDLLLVYGPVRCHLGFPPWRIGYTEIVHMGPLKSMRYGSLVKALHKFTMVRQNYGK